MNEKHKEYRIKCVRCGGENLDIGYHDYGKWRLYNGPDSGKVFYDHVAARIQCEKINIGRKTSRLLKNAAAKVLYVKLRSVDSGEVICCAHCASSMTVPTKKPKATDPNQLFLF